MEELPSFSGAGHSIGPAVIPEGSAQVTRGGSPESPGLTQYVCQPSSKEKWNASVKLWAACTPEFSAMRRTVPWGKACDCAAVPSGRRSPRARNKTAKPSMLRENVLVATCMDHFSTAYLDQAKHSRVAVLFTSRPSR